VAAQAQNIQLHYDFGRNIYSDEEADRQNWTITFENFSADKLGSWYYFADFDINQHGHTGAYTEITREFNIGDKGFAAHLEYDGGLNLGTTFQTSALVGPAWSGHSDDFSKTYSAKLMYKQYFSHAGYEGYASIQFTGVWGITFAGNKMTFSGFVDFWRGKQYNGHGQLVMLAEPQLWYNINDKISVGTECEISQNFIYNTANDKSFFINPTIGFKFNL